MACAEIESATCYFQGGLVIIFWNGIQAVEALLPPQAESPWAQPWNL